jgi:hypothetical protein
VGLVDGQIVPGVGFDLRVQSLHCALRKGVEVIPGGTSIILPLGIINPNYVNEHVPCRAAADCDLLSLIFQDQKITACAGIQRL